MSAVADRFVRVASWVRVERARGAARTEDNFVVFTCRPKGARVRVSQVVARRSAYRIARRLRCSAVDAALVGAGQEPGTLPDEQLHALLDMCSDRDTERIMDADDERDIRAWMRLHAEHYETSTELAEACAIALDHDEWLDNELHTIWDVAVELMDELE
jgi:hypothetical protein